MTPARHKDILTASAVIILALAAIACAPGCTNNGSTTIPANVTLHVDNLYVTVNAPPGTVVVQPGAVVLNASATISASHLLSAPAPSSQPGEKK